MVFSGSSRRASSSRKTPVVRMVISSDSEADGSDFQETSTEGETDSITDHTAASNDDGSDDQFIRSNPRGRINETHDVEVEAVAEAEFLERITQCSLKKSETNKCRAEKPHASNSSSPQEDDIASDDDSSTDEESMAHEHQDISIIATRTHSRGNKNHAPIAKSKPSDTTESVDGYASYCSFSTESDDSDDPDFGSSSFTNLQRIGGRNGRNHTARSECMAEQVHNEDTRERKKKPVVQVDREVEEVHDEDTQEWKKKSVVKVHPVVKRVHDEDTREWKQKSIVKLHPVVERVPDEDAQEWKKNSVVKVHSVVERVPDEDTREWMKKSVVEVDPGIERVHDEDTREQKKKNSMVEVEHVVERVYSEDTGEQKKKKKSMVEVEHVVERVYSEDTGEQKKKKKSMVEVDHVVERVHNEHPRAQKKSTVEVNPVVKLVHQGPMGGKKGKKQMARSEPAVERVYNEDTRERNLEVDPVVKLVHQGRQMGGKGGKNAGRRSVGGVNKKRVAGPESIVKQVQVLEPMREEREKLVRKRVVESIELEPKVPHNKCRKIAKKDSTVEIGEKRTEERQKSVGRIEVVAEHVHREPSPNTEHLNGDLGVNSSHEMRDSLSPLHEEKEQVHEADLGNRKGEEVMDESVENPAKRSNCDPPGKERDFRRLLLDSLLNESPVIIEDRSSEPDSKIPLKFRFDDDEIPKPKEKTEYEIEAENLYAVMNNYFAFEAAQSSYQQEVKEDAAESSDNERTEDHRCCKEHDYIEDDANGMVCRICQHIGLEAKYVQLQWAEKPIRRVGKRKFRSDNERHREECIRFTTPGESSRAVFLNPGEGTVWDIKPGVRRTMYKHQQEGFEFLWKNMTGSIDLAEIASSCSEFGGCIISHAPGTGKTRLTMMFVETYLMLFPDCRPVIIAPSSMLLTWEGEFRKWNVEFPFHNLNNPEVSVEENKLAQRLSKKKTPNSEDIRLAKISSWTKVQSVLGMSYNLFAKLVGEKRPTKKSVQEKEPDPELKMILLEKPGLVVLDEGHIPRNQTSSIWNALMKLRTEKRVVLSGTPFQNNFKELFNVMQVARPSFAISLEKDPRFADMISSNKKKVEVMDPQIMDKAILDLKTAMEPYVNMYNDSRFLQSKLPGLRDFLIILKPTALQKRIIENMERPKSTFESEAKVALVSVHPCLFNPSEEEKLLFDEAEVKKSRAKPDEGVKTRFLMELVRISMARNEKVLVFSQYIEPLLLLQQHLCTGFNWGDSQVMMIKGKMDQKQRQKLMASFNNPNDEAKILLASTRCCSEGVSLVGASRVVLLDVVWNPAVERQAISRAYRIGQTKIVYTYHLMASGTSEMDKYGKQAEKDRLSELVFAASSAGISKTNEIDEGMEDTVLEEMVANVDFQQIFDKITYKPKQ